MFSGFYVRPQKGGNTSSNSRLSLRTSLGQPFWTGNTHHLQVSPPSWGWLPSQAPGLPRQVNVNGGDKSMSSFGCGFHVLCSCLTHPPPRTFFFAVIFSKQIYSVVVSLAYPGCEVSGFLKICPTLCNLLLTESRQAIVHAAQILSSHIFISIFYPFLLHILPPFLKNGLSLSVFRYSWMLSLGLRINILVN